MRPSRWEHFSHIYGVSLLALVPGWVSHLRGGKPDSPYAAVCAVSPLFLPPLLAVAAAILLLGRAPRSALVLATAGALGAYFLGAAVLFVAYPLWTLTMVVTTVVSGAAVGSAIASVIVRLFWLAGRRQFAASSSREARGTGSVRFALWAGALTGAILMPAAIYILMDWAMDAGLLTDSLFIIPLVLSLAAPACCAAFLVIYLTRASA